MGLVLPQDEEFAQHGAEAAIYWPLSLPRARILHDRCLIAPIISYPCADGCGNQPPMTGWLPQPSEPGSSPLVPVGLTLRQVRLGCARQAAGRTAGEQRSASSH